jgi:hypothetical protein
MSPHNPHYAAIIDDPLPFTLNTDFCLSNLDHFLAATLLVNIKYKVLTGLTILYEAYSDLVPYNQGLTLQPFASS